MSAAERRVLGYMTQERDDLLPKEIADWEKDVMKECGMPERKNSRLTSEDMQRRADAEAEAQFLGMSEMRLAENS